MTFFVQKSAKKLGKQISSVSDEAMRRLANYSWPGNIRELQNIVERAVILSPGKTLVIADELRNPALPPGSSRREEAQTSKAAIGNRQSAIDQSLVTSAVTGKNNGSLDDVERRHIESVLNQTNWMIEGERGAAKILEMNPQPAPQPDAKVGCQAACQSLCLVRYRAFQLFLHERRTICEDHAA